MDKQEKNQSFYWKKLIFKSLAKRRLSTKRKKAREKHNRIDKAEKKHLKKQENKTGEQNRKYNRKTRKEKCLKDQDFIA